MFFHFQLLRSVRKGCVRVGRESGECIIHGWTGWVLLLYFALLLGARKREEVGAGVRLLEGEDQGEDEGC